mmetsp:Transcript_17505/g.45766  ORF Transcript_17505/g.45766 Transcript_17505/m.45766 type:complete len:418 (+) Transcript_17505:203-1456(+)
MRLAEALLAVGAAVTVVTAQSTDFNVLLATPPTQDTNQYQLQNEVSVLISAGNVFYDRDNDAIPLQAFEITDQEGNSLGPFEMPTANFRDYIVDLSSLNTGVGLKPYHRGVELVNASDRGWRLDYYKDGEGGSVYSTIMSGPVSQIGQDTYLLIVDLQLRWSEEGDSLNRLGEGFNSHIALALADFNSFTFTMTGAGSGTMEANLFSGSPTTAPPVASTAPTVSPSAAPSRSSTTTTPVPDDVEPANRTFTETFEECMEAARIAAEARMIAEDKLPSQKSPAPKHPKKVKLSPEERMHCEQFREDCDHGGNHGKSKKKCKKKKGKMGISKSHLNDVLQRSTMLIAGAACVILVAGYAKVLQQRRIMSEYEEIDEKPVDTTPVAPTEIKAFGGHDPKDLYEDAKTFHLPPSEVCDVTI